MLNFSITARIDSLTRQPPEMIQRFRADILGTEWVWVWLALFSLILTHAHWPYTHTHPPTPSTGNCFHLDRPFLSSVEWKRKLFGYSVSLFFFLFSCLILYIFTSHIETKFARKKNKKQFWSFSNARNIAEKSADARKKGRIKISMSVFHLDTNSEIFHIWTNRIFITNMCFFIVTVV